MSSEKRLVTFSLNPRGESSSCPNSLGPESLVQILPLDISSSPHLTSCLFQDYTLKGRWKGL